jgi:hypothetical protein
MKERRNSIYVQAVVPVTGGRAILEWVRQVGRLETQRRVDIAQIQGVPGRILSSPGTSVCFLQRMKPTSIMECDLLYSESTDLNTNHM